MSVKMKNSKNTLVAVLAASVYLITVLIYVSFLAAEYSGSTEACEKKFLNVKHSLNVALRTNKAGAKEFSEDFLSSVADEFESFSALQLVLNDKVIFSYPEENAVFNNGKSSLIKYWEETIETSDNESLTLKTDIFLLKPSSIFNKGRVAFIIILITTLFVLFYILFAPEKISTQVSYKEFDEEDNDLTHKTDESDDDAVADDDDVADSNAAGDTGKADESSDEKSYDDFDLKKELVSEKDTVPEKNEHLEKIDKLYYEKLSHETDDSNSCDKDSKSDEKENKETPSGLFSPVTGFGWEEYMMPRLDSELVRAASCEQDISLFTVQIENINWSTDYGKAASKAIIETVQFNDLVFNYKNDGCSFVIQNLNTDKAIEKAEKLHQELTEIFDGFKMSFDIFIGISTRSLRLISGARLATESQEALVHAKEDKDSPIVAFRVNPEKYRNYLNSQTEILRNKTETE